VLYQNDFRNSTLTQDCIADARPGYVGMVFSVSRSHALWDYVVRQDVSAVCKGLATKSYISCLASRFFLIQCYGTGFLSCGSTGTLKKLSIKTQPRSLYPDPSNLTSSKPGERRHSAHFDMSGSGQRPHTGMELHRKQ
jgi:hypothetical protein